MYRKSNTTQVKDTGEICKKQAEGFMQLGVTVEEVRWSI